MLTSRQAHIAKVLGCLLLVYISWGSCFIATKFAIRSFPPFLMGGARMVLAGILLYAWSWMRGRHNLPTRKDWSNSLILAFFMVFLACGFLAKGQEFIASGTAAMISGTVPLWMVMGGWLLLREPRPTRLQFTGLGLGTLGLLALGTQQGLSGVTSPWGLLLLVVSALGWVAGSFYSKRHAGETRLSVMRNSALIMFAGGVQALLAGWLFGERVNWPAVTPVSWAALAALILLGAIVAYTCYFWLLMNTRTAVAVSYEYVNPVIGVFLGWLMAGEQVDRVVILACCAVVGSVFFVVSGGRRG